MAEIGDCREEIHSGNRASSSHHTTQEKEEDYADGYDDVVEYISTESYVKGEYRVVGVGPIAHAPYCDRGLSEHTRAMAESIFPTKWFTDVYSANGWKSSEGYCPSCREVHPMMVPPAKTKENAPGTPVKIQKLGEETEAADVRNMFEPFGALHCVKLCRDREPGNGNSYATVSFVNVDDAERAMEKLKGDGYDIEWSV